MIRVAPGSMSMARCKGRGRLLIRRIMSQPIVGYGSKALPPFNKQASGMEGMFVFVVYGVKLSTIRYGFYSEINSEVSIDGIAKDHQLIFQLSDIRA